MIQVHGLVLQSNRSLVGVYHIVVAHVLSYLFRDLLRHHLVHVYQVQHVLYAILLVLLVERPLVEYIILGDRHHVVELLFRLVYTMGSLILLEELVKAGCFDVRQLVDECIVFCLLR